MVASSSQLADLNEDDFMGRLNVVTYWIVKPKEDQIIRNHACFMWLSCSPDVVFMVGL